MKFKKIISALIGCSMLISTTAFAETDFIILPNTANIENIENMITFSDLPSTHWAYNDVMTIANKGIISGTTTPVNGVGTYDPDGTVTLGQFLAIATRLVASDKIQEGNYAHWAGGNYQAAIQSGLILGSEFAGSPEALNAPISREDMAHILVNVAKANGETLTSIFGIENSIRDFTDISVTRRDAVTIAYSNGLLTGKGNNEFKPYDPLTRAEVAAVFCRVMNYTARPTVTVQQPQHSQEQSNYDSYTVTAEGETKGMLRSKYARQYDLAALDNVKIAEDSNGVYVEFIAPILPDEIKNDFKFIVSVALNKSNGDYFCGVESIHAKSGESGKVYFEDYDENKVTKGMIGYASVSSYIVKEGTDDYMLMHSVDTLSKTKALEDWYDGNNSSTVDYNSSHIFAGIGK